MTCRFITKLTVELQGDGRWVLRRPLAYRSFLLGLVTVPAGFDTDFASVPRVPVVFWLTGDTAKEAAVVHDWLYRTQKVTRKMADQVLAEAATCGIPPEPRWRRWLLYAGVRLCGWVAWRRNRKSGLWPKRGE